MTKPSLSAADFPREVLTLFDQYVHGAIDRRGFIRRCAAVVGSAAAASATLAMLRPDFARAQVIAPDDARIRVAKPIIETPGTGAMEIYVAEPADAAISIPTSRPRPRISAMHGARNACTFSSK